MFQIRGENIYPSEIENVLNATKGYGGEHRVVISREGTMDELLVRAEYDGTLGQRGEPAIADFARRAGDGLQRVLGVRAKIEACPPATFPRTDHKARRVVDDRDLFRDVRERLEATVEATR
jgi:phenylacetate-CoA ligase